MPERLYDDPDELAAWAERALAVAQRAAAGKAKSKQAGPRARA
jgi:DNA transformation protein